MKKTARPESINGRTAAVFRMRQNILKPHFTSTRAMRQEFLTTLGNGCLAFLLLSLCGGLWWLKMWADDDDDEF